MQQRTEAVPRDSVSLTLSCLNAASVTLRKETGTDDH